MKCKVIKVLLTQKSSTLFKVVSATVHAGILRLCLGSAKICPSEERESCEKLRFKELL